MNTRLIISLLCAGALAFACGPRSHSERSALASAQAPYAVVPKVAVHSRRAPAPVKQARLDSRLKVDVQLNEVRFALNVHNVGNKYVELSFPTGKSYDFVVVDSSGREVWHWSDGRMFTQGVQNKQLGTGDAMQVAEAWKKPAQAGRYTAIATLNASNYPVEQRVDFVVP
jgi:hypothetical protein